MSDNLVIVPSNGETYVPLARTKSGRLFRKHLLNYGPLRHPATGDTITIDDDFASALKKNFEGGACDIVQVPLANDQNQHSEDPQRNIGEVVDIEVRDKKIYAVIDVRDPAHADKMGKTYLGASAMMALDYTDTKTGSKVGPTLLHACVTNRPYVTGLENYEEILAATSDTSERAAVLLTTDVDSGVADAPVNTGPAEAKPSDAQEHTDMGDTAGTEATEQKPTTAPTLAELLATLKTDHNIDVAGLQAQAEKGTQTAALSQALATALANAGVVSLSQTDAPSSEDIVGAVAELAENKVALTNRVASLEKRDAEHAVDKLVETGHVLPAQRDAFVDLKLSNPTMFTALIPAQPVVKLTQEKGVNQPDDAAHSKNIDEEVARLAQLHADLSKNK